jgi:anti-sigma B factor antagonist
MTDLLATADGPFKASTTHLDGSVVVALAGDLDLFSEPALREHLEPYVGGHSDVVLNMRRVTFLDSSGIRVLLETTARIGPGRRVVLREVPRQAFRALELCGVLDQFVVE